MIFAKIDQGVSTDAAEAVKSLDGISHIDTVVANAAIADSAAMVAATSTDDVRRHMDVNLIGVLALFHAVEPLLRKGNNPKFIVLSSSLGSATLTEHMPGPWFCYGVTKAAVNYMVRRIHVENDWLTATALQPGWVQTDMGNFAAKLIGMEAAPTTLEDSVAGCIKVIDGASREKYAGKWIDNEENYVPW